MHPYLPKGGRKYDSLIVMEHLDHSEFKIKRRGGDIHDWQVKCVCEKRCNNGWMRTLENTAKPILLPLLKGDSVRLSPHDQEIIAAWASLKAVVAEYASSGHVTTTQAQRDKMMLEVLPPQTCWKVWIGNYDRKNWNGYNSSHPFLFLDGPENRNRLGEKVTTFNGQVSNQVVGKLFIQVMRTPVSRLIEKWRFDERANDKLRVIWPVSPYSIVWPPPVMGDRDADYVSSAYSIFLRDSTHRALARHPRSVP